MRTGQGARGRVDRFVLGGSLPDPILVTRESRRSATAIGAREHRNPLLRRIDRAAARAQVHLTAGEVIGACAILATLGATVTLLLSGALAVALVVGAAFSAAPFLYLRRRQTGLLRRFDAQLPATLDILVAAVRAGQSFPTALERVAVEAPEPTRSAFARMVREIGFGLSIEEALARLAERYPSEDLDLIIAAVVVQQRVGGNLPAVLELIAETTRERVRLRGEMRALTAQQRYSAYMLTLFPIVAAVGLFLLNPDYLSPLLEPGLGRIALGVAIALIVVGFLAMRWIGDTDL